ncbi:hypothetical protein SAMN03159423_1864 [Bradyrhizobium sp. NFR13]|uniref:hypothetical protein n=1 Tax=Bradyrhizobium sp. NFR13 TaxID=1566285 RepID=UPI0008DF8403|nr:hypothetical protein [Bradyrhizobium sp. NFR13]SFL41351.1 hypothetical protein SAMN03159423_1864 [Bradyrhizobium sp. NFR13]
MPSTTDSNLEIAKRANDEARADFATWVMMAKLKSLDALPQEAQTFYAGYLALLARGKQSEPAAAEATIQTVYRSYYSRMGGTGIAPIIKTASRSRPMSDDNNSNVTPFRRIKPNTPPPPREKKKLPAALIFIGLIVLAVAWRYLTKGSL